MKRVLFALVFLLVTISKYAVESDKSYTISGKYLVAKSSRLVRLPDEQRTTTAAVVVTYEKVNDFGEIEEVELIKGNFANNSVRLEGEIDKPTIVQISVQDGETDVSNTSALVVPGGPEIVFAFTRHMGLRDGQTKLDLLGTAQFSEEASSKFTIKGDFRSLKRWVPLAQVNVSWQTYVDGELKIQRRASVLTEDQTFLIEADIDEAIVADILVHCFTDNFFFSFLDVVLEPNAEITVGVDKSEKHLIATATNGRHALLIDSWSQSEDYLEKSLARDAAFARQLKERGLPKLISISDSTDSKSKEKATSNSLDGSDSQSQDSASLDEIKTETSPILQKELLVDSSKHEGGCEHVVLSELQAAHDDDASEDSVPEFEILNRELDEYRTNALQNIAKNATDPMNALLALELGAFAPTSQHRDAVFPIYNKLESTLDDDLVERRVSPRRANLQRDIEKWDNDHMLVPGQKVPAFVLSSFDGTEFTLDDITKESDFVLIDFWSSSCISCTDDFSRLKELYASYANQGFEIVGIFVDSKIEDWKESIDKYRIPWINLGEIEGWNGQISRTYGVSSVPKRYLIDTQGCILKKDLSISDVIDFLANRVEAVEN